MENKKGKVTETKVLTEAEVKTNYIKSFVKRAMIKYEDVMESLGK